jgi:hypothetical protein
VFRKTIGLRDDQKQRRCVAACSADRSSTGDRYVWLSVAEAVGRASHGVPVKDRVSLAEASAWWAKPCRPLLVSVRLPGDGVGEVITLYVAETGA